MNTQLVESLAQIIKSLSLSERVLLEEKVQTSQKNWQEEYQKLITVQQSIWARHQNQPLEPSSEDIVNQMREERTEQIMQAAFLHWQQIKQYKEE